MAKQKKVRDQSHTERLRRSEERWPDHAAGGVRHDAVTTGRLTDDSGLTWALLRELNGSAARRLAATADDMVVGDADFITHVPRDERATVWRSIETSGVQPGETASPQLGYQPYEFDSPDGQTLLFVQRRC